MNRWWIFILLPCWFHLTTTFKQQQGGCYFPDKWMGTWFQSGIRQPIVIEGSRLSSKGRCLSSEGDKFLILDDKRACYRCVVIHEKHANVLQYKETYCYGRETLPSLCSYITGDALLYSMFRENAAPVPCPFRGPFTFTYNRGYGECLSPVSSIDSCIEDSRLLLNYQACPDVTGSESAVEELQCLAVWKEGSSRYLVGKVHHSHATSNEDRFRCFVYEKSTAGSEVDFRVAQSGDATCNGLFSATDGSRTMTLKRAPSLNKCRFPPWVANFNHWHTLNYSETYNFHRNSTLRIINSTGIEKKVVCTQVRQTSRDESSVVLLTHYTTKCQSGFTCMSFTRRDIHVIELQIGISTKRPEDACGPPYFNRTSQSYVTLVTSSPESRPCPYMGKFFVNNMIRTESGLHTNKRSHQVDSRYLENFYVNKFTRMMYGESQLPARIKRVDQEVDCDIERMTSLVMGCNSIDTMGFDSSCPAPEFMSSYSCHGSWKENGTNYLITSPLGKPSHGVPKFCFMYRESSADDIQFSTSSANCDRSLKPGVLGELIFNITKTGECIEINGTSKTSAIFSTILITNLLHIIMIKVQR